MDNLQLKKCRLRKPECLSAKPVVDVFEDLVNPDITTKFWSTKSRGTLEAGKQVQWDWEIYGIFDPGDGASRRTEQAGCHCVAAPQ